MRLSERTSKIAVSSALSSANETIRDLRRDKCKVGWFAAALKREQSKTSTLQTELHHLEASHESGQLLIGDLTKQCTRIDAVQRSADHAVQMRRSVQDDVAELKRELSESCTQAGEQA